MKKAEILKLLQESGLSIEDLTKPDEPEIIVHSYQCDKCRIKFQSAKLKRKCPDCKSSQIKIIKEVTSTTQQTQSDPTEAFIHRPGKLILNDKKGKRPTRVEDVNIQTKPIDLNECKEDTVEFDKKVVFTKSQRVRPHFKPLHLECTRCHHTFDVNPATLLGRDKTIWECDHCLLNKR